MNGLKRTAAKIYGLDKQQYKKFTEKDNCIIKAIIDPDFPYYHQYFKTNMTKFLDSNESGYSRVDLALYSASWTVNSLFRFAKKWNPKTEKQTPSADFMPEEVRNSPPGKISTDKLTGFVKKAAKFFGASGVGIADLDRNWLYDHIISTESKEISKKSNNPPFPFSERELPNSINKAIVMTVEMDALGMSCAPNFLEAATSGLGYSKMSFIIACLAEFIRNLGYKAVPCGNDTGLSIPMAIDAGLGALGRNGILITKDFGPRIRLCKILTNMPLNIDGPDVNFINKITSFCKTCRKCAEACDAKAISFDKEPSYDIKSISNNSGVKKWYVNVEECYGKGWVRYSGDCGKCIQVCPFSKTEEKSTPEEFWGELYLNS
ncbi:MAG: reductive dehalogenase [Promethearchaeota archaeon]